MVNQWRRVTAVLLVALLLVAGSVDGGRAVALSVGGELLIRISGLDVDVDLARLAVAPITPLAFEPAPRPYVLARSDEQGLAWLKANGLAFDVLDADAQDALYCMADVRSSADVDLAAAALIAGDEHHLLLRTRHAPTGGECPWPAWPLEGPVRLLPRPAPRLPATVAPIAQVQDIIAQVDVSRMMSYLDDLSGETPALVDGQPYTITTRYSYSGEPLEKAVDYMAERLNRLGLDVSFHWWSHPPQVISPLPNVVAEKRGTTRPDDIYIICAHLDSTVRSPANPNLGAPGADDNASGSVAVLTAAELLSAYNFDATLRFVLFTGEEQGLWGSEAYAAYVRDENIMGVLNLDMIAWDSQDGPDIDLHARSSVPGSVALGDLFVDVVNAYGLNLLPVVYGSGLSASDHSSFWGEGFAAVLAIENYFSDGVTPSDFNAYYHTTGDRSSRVNQAFFAEMTRAALATFAHMAGLRTDCYWADLDCNCQVDVLDLEVVTGRWGAQRGQWDYQLVYDQDRDDSIRVDDVQRFAAQWNWTCTPPRTPR